MRKRVFFLVLSVILILILIGSILYYKRIENDVYAPPIESLQQYGINPDVTIRPKMTGRGQDVSTNDTLLYQFPVTVLSELQTDLGAYSYKVFAFNDEHEFDLLLGPSNAKLMFGTCSFDENGETTSEAVWSSTDISSIVGSIHSGSKLLVRIGYPFSNNAVDEKYKQATEKSINALRNNGTVTMVVPLSLCMEQ